MQRAAAASRDLSPCQPSTFLFRDTYTTSKNLSTYNKAVWILSIVELFSEGIAHNILLLAMFETFLVDFLNIGLDVQN